MSHARSSCHWIRPALAHPTGALSKDQNGLNRRNEMRPPMPKLRVCGFSLSVDGYGAGPHQDTANSLGLGGRLCTNGRLSLRSRRCSVARGVTTGVDDHFAARVFENVGAWIMGRNMFGPVRGPWPDEFWKGWWGSNLPYHTPVFVQTHYHRDPVVMEGGTTFHFRPGWNRGCAPTRQGCGERARRPGWRRRCYDPAVPTSRARRRNAPRHCAGSAGRRGEPLRGYRC
jgi:dihydrofolate reductase